MKAIVIEYRNALSGRWCYLTTVMVQSEEDARALLGMRTDLRIV